MSRNVRYMLFWYDEADPSHHQFYKLVRDERELEEAVNQVAVGNVCYREISDEEYALLKAVEDRIADIEKEEGGIEKWLKANR